MRKTEEVDGNGVRIRVRQLGAADAPLALTRAGRLLGAAIGAADSAAMELAFFAAFNDDDFTWLRSKFLTESKQVVELEQSNGGTLEKEVPLRIDVFDGNLKGQLAWFTSCIMVNFADFLATSTASTPGAAAAKASGSSSPNALSGGSGDASSTSGSAQA